MQQFSGDFGFTKRRSADNVIRSLKTRILAAIANVLVERFQATKNLLNIKKHVSALFIVPGKRCSERDINY